MGSGLDSLLIFKMRGIKSPKSDQPEQASHGAQLMEVHEELPQVESVPIFQPRPAPPPTKATEATKRSLENEGSSSIYYKVSGEYPDPMKYYNELSVQSGIVEPSIIEKHPMPRVASRESARKKFCVTHPFRHAYALCAFCHRPFCFEDIVEYRKEYYCISDIDRVEAKQTERVNYEYGIASLITAFLLMIGFVVYMYFSHGSILYLLNYIAKIGVLQFIVNLKIPYVMSIGGIIVMFASIGASIYILTGARHAHVTVAAITILAVAFFTYQYITTFTGYILLIDIIEFVGFLCAVYSASSGVQVYNQNYEQVGGFGLAYGYNTKF